MSSEIQIGDTAIDFWGKFVKKWPIRFVQSVAYSRQQHGVSSRNHPNPPYIGMVVPENPKLKETIFSRWKPTKKRDVLAIGSLFFIWPWKEKNGPGVVPMAVVSLDLDLPKTFENEQKVISILDSYSSFTDWVLIDSGNSYHLIFDNLVKPENLPWHYGKLINSFLSLDFENGGKVIETIGDLQTFWQDSDKIREFCDKIFKNICHYDENVPNKFHFPIDLRWVAHTLLELLNYTKSRDDSFGFLRITGKPSPTILRKSTR